MQDFNIPKSFLNRSTRLWNTLSCTLELTNNDVTFKQHKNDFFQLHYVAALTNNYDVDNPKTFKSICLVTSVVSCPVECYLTFLRIKILARCPLSSQNKTLSRHYQEENNVIFYKENFMNYTSKNEDPNSACIQDLIATGVRRCRKLSVTDLSD